MAGVERQNVGGKSLTVCSVAPSGTWSEHVSTLDKDTIHVRHFKLHYFINFITLNVVQIQIIIIIIIIQLT